MMDPDGSAFKDPGEPLTSPAVFGEGYGFHLCCCYEKEGALALSSHSRAGSLRSQMESHPPHSAGGVHSLASVQGTSSLLFLRFPEDTSQKY